MSKTKKISLDEIKLKERLRVRAEMDQGAIAEFAEAMEEGAKFPPVDVFAIDGGYFLADGWHRYYSLLRLGAKDTVATIHQGDAEAALTFALRANQAHGIRRTNADKRRAVAVALETWPKLSSRGIADLCGVSHEFVQQARQLSTVDSSTRVGKDGKERPAKREYDFGGDGEREEKEKDEKESADADRKEEKAPPWKDWATFQEAARYMLDDIGNLEKLTIPPNHAVAAGAACRLMAARLVKLAEKWNG